MVAWTPVRADEISSGKDRFASQTFETTVPLRTHSGVKPVSVSVFMPTLSRNANALQVHVFFSPGGATETGVKKTPPLKSEVGLNAANIHGLRGSTDRSSWVLISVPGAEPGFIAMDEDGIAACLSAVGGAKYTADDIFQIRLSSHSRGTRGLVQSLMAPPAKTKTPYTPLPAEKIDRVVVFDDAGEAGFLATSAIPGDKQFAYQVNDTTKLSKKGATNVRIDPLASRAIGYCRLIADAAITGPVAGADVPAFSGDLLPLPARTKLSTRKGGSGMTNINDFANTAANKKLIASIIKEEAKPSGMFKFITDNNLTRMGSFPPGILSHHLFVAELAHETVD